MKKMTIISLTLLLAFSACFLQRKAQKPHQKYLPDEFRNVYFGMPLEEFEKLKKGTDLEQSDLMSFRISITEKKPEKAIKEVTYYFDNENEKPLYELIIEYKDATERDKVARELLGQPNSGEEWAFDTGEGFLIKAWKFDKKLVVVGELPGTEWND